MGDALSAQLEKLANFRAPDAPQRAEFLRRIGEEIDALGDELLQVCNRETNLPLPRLQSERARTTNQLALFADLIEEGSWVDARIDTAQPDRKPLPKPDVRRMLVPLGPVAVFSASNFPFAFSVAGGDTASALAAGCSVVVKPHPGHPETSRLVAGAIQKAAVETGMPANIFYLVSDTSVEAGRTLVAHPVIQAVGFTGSTKAGRALFDLAAARPLPIPVFAEMSSLNPVLLLPEALRERRDDLVRGVVGSVTLGVGQFCTKPGIVLGFRGSDLSAFTDALGKALAQVAPAPMLYRGLEERLSDSLQKVKPFLRVTGAAHLLTASAAEFQNHPELQEEIFGPATLVIECENEADLLRSIAVLPGQLTATIHLTDGEIETSRIFLQSLAEKVGRLILNGYPTGVEVCPSMHHGGPYPATSDPRFTSVGTAAIFRFARPICFQNFAEPLLPLELRNANDLGIWRLVNGQLTKADAPQGGVVG
ncbi:MAG: aldehyde dehydrogenase (NADP(+)) [Verrucomicrobia bacterium]|nr:aldehyde dehydrogenase (NADP(+)) [Verrucomicrobiota bacterium]